MGACSLTARRARSPAVSATPIGPATTTPVGDTDRVRLVRMTNNTPSDATLQQVAADLAHAYATGVPIAPVRDRLADGGIDAAYRVQQLQTEQWWKRVAGS